MAYPLFISKDLELRASLQKLQDYPRLRTVSGCEHRLPGRDSKRFGDTVYVHGHSFGYYRALHPRHHDA